VTAKESTSAPRWAIAASLAPAAVLASTFPNGRTGEPRVKAGQSMWHPAGAHLIENLGDTRFELVLTELRTPLAAIK